MSSTTMTFDLAEMKTLTAALAIAVIHCSRMRECTPTDTVEDVVIREMEEFSAMLGRANEAMENRA